MNLDEGNARGCFERAAAAERRDIRWRDGRGIVICAGGVKYLTCAWVAVHMLRHHGTQLPIQLWHRGPRELLEPFRKPLEKLDVEFVDALAVATRWPARILNGWELKPYAILHSPFREVMLLDADNLAVRDPTDLFDAQEYRRTRAVFWPDIRYMRPDATLWRLTGIPYVHEWEFETGQIVVDKEACWRELQLTMWMNEYSDFWYRHMLGDKETFHMAWRKLATTYSMPDYPVKTLAGTMCQHDFAGARLFQHRNMLKWSIWGNEKVPGFMHEELCFEFLDDLQKLRKAITGVGDLDPLLAAAIGGHRFTYVRVGHDSRPMYLTTSGTVTEGSAAMELHWRCKATTTEHVLELYGADGLTARLSKPIADERGVWVGMWLIHERMPVELRPLSSQDICSNT